MTSTNKRASEIADLVESVATALDNSTGTIATARAIGTLMADESESGYAMSGEALAGVISRARARLGNPDAKSGALDVLATASEYRVTRQAVEQYRAAVRRLDGWNLATEGEGTDALILASYNLATKSGRGVGDKLAQIGETLAGTPAGKRQARAVKLLTEARAWWLAGGDTPTPDAPVVENVTSDDSTGADDTAPAGNVPASPEVVAALIAGIAGEVAGYSGPQLVRVIDALDALYATLDGHPAAQDARAIMHKRDTATV